MAKDARGKNNCKKSNELSPDEKITAAEQLRLKAMMRLTASATAAAKTDGQPTADYLLHELQVHQVELEMQNEALQESQQELREARDRYRDRYVELYDFAPVGYITLNNKGIIQEANLTAATMLGVERSKLLRHGFSRFVSPDNPDHWYLHLATVWRQEKKQDCELFLQRGNNSRFYARLESVRVQKESDGEILIYTTIADISLKKKAEDLTASVLESIDEGFIIINRDFQIVSANRAYAENIGSSLGAIIGQPCYKISHNFDSPCYLNGEDCAVKHVFDTGAPNTTFHTHYNKKGQPFYVETKAFALDKNNLDEVQTVIEIVIDISEKKQREEEIHHLAFYDPLTNLPNRRLLMDRLEQAFIASGRTGQYGAVLFLDLDHFKSLNDIRGHATGDLLLVEVSRRLQAVVREDDTVSRLGGDEFVILLKNLSAEKHVAITQTGHVAEKIRTDLRRPFILAGHEQHITASIGIGLFCRHDIPLAELLQHADTAMYQAKQAGRDTVNFFDPAMQAALEAASALEADLRQAIKQGQFQLHYQPQTDSNGRIIGAEALLRWTHPGRGPVSPTTFIPLAEETGLILPIGRWVLEEACAQLKTWSDIVAATGLRLAVNISARQFQQPDFVAEVREIIAASGIDPTNLKFELTESLVLMDVADTIAKMQVLGAMGIGFSMDDFGTGYSSLSQLKRLPLEQLKIDQSFICDLNTGLHDAEIVKTIIAMGRILGFHVIAEGVETEEQLTFLANAGCDAYQGYLFSRPVPAMEFKSLLEAGAIERK